MMIPRDSRQTDLQNGCLGHSLLPRYKYHAAHLIRNARRAPSWHVQGRICSVPVCVFCVCVYIYLHITYIYTYICYLWVYIHTHNVSHITHHIPHTTHHTHYTIYHLYLYLYSILHYILYINLLSGDLYTGDW